VEDMRRYINPACIFFFHPETRICITYTPLTMSLKRPAADDTNTPASRPRRQNFKRIKLSPAAQDEATNSSEPSSGSVSEDSALRSSPQPSDHTRNSGMSSLPPSGVDEEDGSESSVSSTSSESSGLESEDEAEITTIGRPKKPVISREGMSEDLRARLAGFLPQMADANRLLESQPEGWSLEDVGEGEQFIEMSLGLGVLEEQGDGGDSSDESESDQEEGLEDDLPASSDGVKRSQQDREADVLGKLMGQSRSRHKVGIQDAE